MKFLIAGAALLASMLTSALAADMPVKAPRAAPLIVADDWRGVYFGIHGGENLGSFNPVFGTGLTATEVNLDDNSPFVGGHIGYNLQSGGLVFGPELGVQYWGQKKASEIVPAVGVIPAVLLQERVDWVAYANVRLGFAPLSSLLIYATGGAAWAHVKGELINLAAIDTTSTQSLLGWNIGAGLEYKLTPSIVLGAEYRHYDFGSVQSVNPVIALALGIKSGNLTNDQAMARLSFRTSAY
jgi:outer membrane immunogenic protein